MTQILKGYHYTSKENWEKIQKDGILKRHHSHNCGEIFNRYFPGGVNGVWIFKELDKTNHICSVKRIRDTFMSDEAVKLQVLYTQNEALSYQGKRLELVFSFRNSETGKYMSQVPIEILTKDIPIERVKLIGVYPTEEYVKMIEGI